MVGNIILSVVAVVVIIAILCVIFGLYRMKRIDNKVKLMDHSLQYYVVGEDDDYLDD